MKMNGLKNPVRITLLLAFAMLFAWDASAQCKVFAKKRCVPELGDYKFNESFNAAKLFPGEDAEVSLTFFSGQNYRIVVCNQDIIGDINWQVLDGANRILFESFAGEDSKSSFDLKVLDTQQLKVKVWVPDMKTANEMAPQGCVAILVGFKEP